MSLFESLKRDAADEWRGYVEHEFVRALGAGTLPVEAFKYYLRQDYLFLIHFARAYALAAYKADTVADMRAATTTLRAILDVEMGLHVKYCARWGIAKAEMEAGPEDNAGIAYTRYVLERGMAGDILDLQVALSPCVIGYGVIGQALARASSPRRQGNPYSEWIAMYSGAEYQAVVHLALDQLERLWARRGSDARYPQLVETFRAACRLEADFWQMGLNAAKG